MASSPAFDEVAAASPALSENQVGSQDKAEMSRDHQVLTRLAQSLRPGAQVELDPKAAALLATAAARFAARAVASGASRAKHRSGTSVDVCDLRDFVDREQPHLDVWGFALDDLAGESSTLQRVCVAGSQPLNRRHVARLEMKSSAERSILSDGDTAKAAKKRLLNASETASAPAVAAPAAPAPPTTPAPSPPASSSKKTKKPSQSSSAKKTKVSSAA